MPARRIYGEIANGATTLELLAERLGSSRGAAAVRLSELNIRLDGTQSPP